MSEPRERETVAVEEARARLRTKWGPNATDDTLFRPWLYLGVLSTVGIEYRDGQFYGFRRSPQGGRKEQDNG